MSWLLFLDESGHDHRAMPYEVRGGVALHAKRLWSFVRSVQRLELDAFGTTLAEFGKELKGCKLLDKDRFRWAAQRTRLADGDRRRLCRAFLTKGQEKKAPVADEFAAYGQACLEMAHGIFQILRDHDARLFASIIPCSARAPEPFTAGEFLRKDHVFLLERYFYFLEERRDHGLLVMDAVEKTWDRRFIRRLERYFTRSDRGRQRTAWIVPTPLFVASDLTYPVQAADLAIYCINCGYRMPKVGLDAPVRAEIADSFGRWLHQLQFRGKAHRDGDVFDTFGIVFVPDPYSNR